MTVLRRSAGVAACVLLSLAALALGLAARATLPGLSTGSAFAQTGTEATTMVGEPELESEGEATEGTTAAAAVLPQAEARMFTAGRHTQGKVLIGDLEVIRTVYPHNGLQPYERATLAAARINLALQEGAGPDDFRAVQQGGEWVVVGRDRVILSLEPREPRAFRLSAQELAERWASNIKIALHRAMGTHPGEGSGLPPLAVEAREVMMGEFATGVLLVGGKEVLRLTRGGVGMTPVQRAAVVGERLQHAVASGVLPQDIRAVVVGDLTAVQAGELLIVTAKEDDALDAGTTPLGLAQAWANKIAEAVRTYYATAGRPSTLGSDEWQPPEPYDDKWVPIISVLEGVKVGLARVNGPRSRVGMVQAVAQLETHWRNYLEIDIYLPISTKVPGRTLDRVEGCGVTGLADIGLL